MNEKTKKLELEDIRIVFDKEFEKDPVQHRRDLLEAV